MSAGPPVTFSALPLNQDVGDAFLNAWGAYGANDELGFLNRQTDAVVASAAASEIRTGIRVSLNAEMNFQGDKPLFGRQAFEHDLYLKKPRIVHDDTWHFNTQSSTQWDGLRHFGYQKAQRFYNNVSVTDISGSMTDTSTDSKPRTDILGIHHMSQKSIVGRAILVDFARWSSPSHPGHAIVQEATHGKGFKHFQRSAIKFEWILQTLAYQSNTTPRFGDILIIRSGFFPAYEAALSPSLSTPTSTSTKATIAMATEEESQKENAGEINIIHQLHKSHPKPPTLGGVEFSVPFLQYVWQNFSAVASDHPGFEQIPMETPHSLHEVLLAGWGCPIGELFDLEAVSRECERQGRWSFFLSSSPMNVRGGVASPANAVAIF